MDFYISWSHSDPFYQLYDPQCSMLISTTAISNSWRLNRFSVLPHQIILDSGSYSYIANQLPLPTPKQIFHHQLNILKGTDIPTIICAVDKPILGKTLSLTEKNQAIDKTIANAWELQVLMAEYYKALTFGKQRMYPIEPLAIIQGYDMISMKYCAKRLLELGYRYFGIGSMAHLYNTKEIVRRVEVVQSVVGSSVHIFGVSAIETMKKLSELEVASVDSARPIKAAIYNAILYSEPYRRFGIAGSHFRPGTHKFSANRLLSELSIPCPCPVCENKINNDILKLGVRKHLLQRAVHNYYHVKKMIVGWPIQREETLVPL
jgi:tRNA-guanine family transglycosylase